jgi:hypothetical protein
VNDYELVEGTFGWSLTRDGEDVDLLDHPAGAGIATVQDVHDAVLEAATRRIFEDGHAVKAWEHVESNTFRAVLA